MNDMQSDAISILVREHDAVKQRFGVLLEAEGARRAAVLEEIKQMLAVHNASEENVIYPAVNSIAERPMHARTLYHEQDDAEVGLWELSQMKPDDPEFVRKGADVRDALLAHVKREEETEFKHLREEMSAEEAQKLNEEFHAFRVSLAEKAGSMAGART